jgi:2-methylisocitrate lyase-like PEP mutase family enzyme
MIGSMLEERCGLLRSLHVPGAPLVLPNAWDVPSARAVVAAGFPVVATSSGAVAESLGYEDHEGAPADEMFAAAGRIAAAVDVPVTVDAEAGYGTDAIRFVDALARAGAAGCNLEDTDHATGGLRDVADQAARLSAVHRAATDAGYGLVINARVDVFLHDRSGPDQRALVDAAAERGRAYLDAGADCVYPIFLFQDEAVGAFVEAVGGRPVNILALPNAPALDRLAELGVARLSYGTLIHQRSMADLAATLAQIPR